MVVPAAIFIESAQDYIKDSYPKDQIELETKEFKFALGAAATDEKAAGYVLGLATARVLLLENPNAVAAKVEI